MKNEKSLRLRQGIGYVRTNMTTVIPRDKPRLSPPQAGPMVDPFGRLIDYVRVSVTDHGPGIPHEFRNRIFQKFSQADPSDTKQKAGTGLGLAIAKELIESMNGLIGFTSDANVATCFHFELPIWVDPSTRLTSELDSHSAT